MLLCTVPCVQKRDHGLVVDALALATGHACKSTSTHAWPAMLCCVSHIAAKGAREPDRQGNKTLCDNVLCYAMLCYAMLCYAMLCYAMLCYAMLCYAMLCYVCYALLCYAMLCYAMLCYAMLCYALLFHAMPCYAVLQVARIVGVNEGYIGQRCRGGGAQSDASAKHARFAAACALNALLCEQSAWTVEQTWGLPSGLTQQGHPLLKHELTCVKTIKVTLFPRLSLPASIIRPTAHCLLAVLWKPCYVSYVSKMRLRVCCPPWRDKVQHCQPSPSMQVDST